MLPIIQGFVIYLSKCHIYIVQGQGRSIIVAKMHIKVITVGWILMVLYTVHDRKVCGDFPM